MITQIFGVLIEKNPPFIVVDVNGIGYEISVPMSSYYLLPEINQKIKLLTHFIVKEDGHFLYGFVSEEERYIFRLLLKVSGIGAKIAIAILIIKQVMEVINPKYSFYDIHHAFKRISNNDDKLAQALGFKSCKAIDSLISEKNSDDIHL